MIARGDVYWADLPVPSGSEAGFRRPVIVVQSDAINRSPINTVVCVPLTANLRRASAPGNIVLSSISTGLPQDSVASAVHIFAVNKVDLSERVGHVGQADLGRVMGGLDIVLGRDA